MTTELPSQRASERYFLWDSSALVLQLAFVLYTFRRLIFHPGQYLMVNGYDGIKSYFSIEKFLRQPLDTGMLMHGHNYPFGEYMYYTDGTPLLVETLHVLVRLWPAAEPYGLYLYDLFFLAGLVLSTGLLLRILHLLQLPNVLCLILSVALPWLAPQTIRLNVGHLSLSYTPVLLFALWILLEIYLRWQTNQPTRRWWIGVALGIWVASYLHFYYLAILGTFAGLFLLFWVFDAYLCGQRWLRLLVQGGSTLLMALVLTWGSIILLDDRYALRPTGSGYDFISWKLQIGGIFRSYYNTSVHFLLERTESIPYESAAYLGAFCLYALVLIAILALARRLPCLSLKENLPTRFLLLLLLASVPLLFVALGETVSLDDNAYTFYNYFNPFYWLHLVTDRVTQFRALGRFVWPFWWALNLGVAGWIVKHWWQQGGIWRLLVAGLLVLLFMDVRDAIRFYMHYTQEPNLLTDSKQTHEMQSLIGWANSTQYQAILPIPFYHIGSEGDYSYSTDPDNSFAVHTYQLSVLSGLPLMSHNAARAPLYQAQELFSIFRPEGADPTLLNRMNNLPVLVFLDSSYYNGSSNYYRENLKDRSIMLSAYERGDAFIREQNMRRIGHQGNYSLYVWYPKKP